jgi:RHS repeat-associated protein
MYCIINKNSGHTKRLYAKWLLLLFIVVTVATANAQNINNPNKRGPLGTQVNTLSGNLFIPRTDIYIPARAFDLDIRFYYNSYLFTEEYGYGKGWTFEYNIKYSCDTTPGARLILWGNGREDKYDSLTSTSYKSPRGFFSTLKQYQPNKYVLTELDSVKYFFDNAIHKKVTRMQEPNGNFINFNYTDSLLTSMTNNAGQSISFTYNPQGRLASVVDAIATPTRTFTYSYDGLGNLKEVKDPLNGKYQYTYLANGPMKSLADKNNNKVDIIYFPDLSTSELIGCNKRISFSYDTTSNTTVVTDHLIAGNQVTKYTYKKLDNIAWITSMSGNCCGYNMSYEHDDQGNQIKMTDANGQVYNYTYDANGNMLTAKDPLNQVSTYTYTSDFKKINSFKDAKGNMTTVVYDNKGNLTQMTTPGNHIYTATYNATGDIISSTDPKGNSYIYNYDAYGNPTNVTGPNGYNATLAYDARGRMLAYTDAIGNNATAEYDILDRLKKITDPINNFAQFNYDAAGNIVAYTNKNNETSTMNYDASNRVVKGIGPTGNQTSYTYDGMNNMTSVKNALGHETKMSYDNRNRMSATTDAEGNNATYNYDGNGNVTSVNLPNGRSINYSYDGLNRITNISDATGTIATLAYDKNNNITSYVNGTGAITTAAYDSLDRLKQITDPLGNKASYSYDKNNNIISVTDREGRISYFTYDSLDRRKTYTDNNGFITTIGYDAQSNIISLKDQNNNTTTYTYDSLNRRKTMTYPDGKFMNYSYDKKSNVTSIRLTDATNITYLYDTLNRLASRTLPGGEVYSFTYDKLSRVLTATNNSVTTSFTYDNLNRVTAETFDGRTTRYNYNIAGRTQTIFYPDSTKVVKEFDTRNRLIKITKDSVTVVEYAYNNADQPINKTFANGINSAMQYDFANRLSSISTLNGSIQNTSFTYDKEQNKTGINRLNNPALSEQFTYDNGYRLTNYKRGIVGSPTLQNTYTYDAVGNRTAANLNGVATTYSKNNMNQLTSVNGTNFTFDNRGNITYDGIFYKTYDAENRLKKDSSAPSSVITYGYDAIGRRIAKTINGNTLKYTYSGAAQIEERSSSNVLLNRTVFTNFLNPVMNEKAGSKYYYHQNELGSVEAITNNNGRLVESYRYDAYGKPTRYDSLNSTLASSIAGNRVGFTGQEYDSASGSYRFFYRNYSPTTGVFNQRDLIEYEDGMGMYQYVGNNPGNGVDVWGLKDGSSVSNTSNPISLFPQPLGGPPSGGSSIGPSIGPYGGSSGGSSGSSSGGSAIDPSNNMRCFNNETDKNWFKFMNDVGSNTFTGMSIIENGGNFFKGFSKGAGSKFGPIMSLGDYAYKLDNYNKVSNNPSSSGFEKIDAGFDLVASGANVLGGSLPGAIIGGIDGGIEGATGKNTRQHLEKPMSDKESNYYSKKGFEEWAHKYGLDGDIYYLGHKDAAYYNNEIQSQYDFLYNLWLHDKEATYLKTRDGGNQNRCNPPDGTRKPPPSWWNGFFDFMLILFPLDPNEIIGPTGQTNKKWVSVKDRMPYTILFENDTTATARTRYIKITTPVEPKQDAASLELGSFGFNNQSFTIPTGLSSYTQRLDVRDSTGVFVDITAGYDVLNNQIFWELQAIDPLTLQPPEDPLAGFLFLQDTSKPEYGNGFVNFNIKPKTNAVALDTIVAKAFIVFDENAVIPTNLHKNTIDAVAPTSSITNLPDLTPDTEVNIHYTGTDDANGSGVKWYAVYVSDNDGPQELFVNNFTKADTTFRGIADHKYKFYVAATDTAGNVEVLKLLDSVVISNGQFVICPNGNISFDAKLNGASFQWQVNNGTGYANITNGALYSGATAAVLSITNAPTSMYGYQYRCLVNGSIYSDIFLLKFGMTWQGTVSNVWENPVNWSCNSLPDVNTDVTIDAGKLNYPQVNVNTGVRTIRVNTGGTLTVKTGATLTVVK